VVAAVDGGKADGGTVVCFLQFENLNGALATADDDASAIRRARDAVGMDIRLPDVHLHGKVIENAETAVLKGHHKGWDLRVRVEDNVVESVVCNIRLASSQQLQLESIPDQDRVCAVADRKENLVRGYCEKSSTAGRMIRNDVLQRRVTVAFSVPP
jgi:hypothetical protein